MHRNGSDDEQLVSQAFYVGDCSNVDINLPAVSGVDYIKKVHVESKRCPAVVVANLDMEKFNSKQTVRYDRSNGFIPAPPGLVLSESVQKAQVYTFSLLREQLFSKMDKIKELSYPIKLPHISDRISWCTYCLGSETCYTIFNAYFNESEDKIVEGELIKVKGHEPLLSVILSVPYSDNDKLLSYHIDWMEAVGFCRLQGLWIFAILSVLQKPLDPDTCYLLRRLSRTCAKLRAELATEMDEHLFGLNYIICLIANYFDQKDMSDHFLPFKTPVVENMDVESMSSCDEED